MARPEREGYDGLSKIAHAIRRVGALYVAMSILPPESTTQDLKDTADDLAKWIGGNAQAQEDQAPGGGSLGVPWHERD